MSICEQLCQSKYMKNQTVINWAASSFAAFLISGCSHSSSVPRTTPDTGRIQGQYIAGSTQLVDAGNTTPEAALESVFWAMANGNYDAVIGAYIPQMRKEAEGWYGDKTKFMAHNAKFVESFKGLQIVSRKVVADDKVELRYYNEHQNQPASKRTDQIQSLVKMGGAWKLADKTPYTTNWDAGSQPEPQP